MSKKLFNKIFFFIFLLILFSSIYSLNNNNDKDYSNKIHVFNENFNNISFLGDVFDDDDDGYVTTDKNCNMTEYPEQAVKCKNLTHMECKDKKYYHHCSCKPGYITYPKDNFYYCNLKQKKQSIAFVLEICVGFGAGHFYRHHYKMAGLKLAGFILGIVFICTFPITAKFISDCECDCLAIFLSIIYYLYMCGLAVWYIWDLVYFGKNKYMDYTYYEKEGHIIPLKHW